MRDPVALDAAAGLLSFDELAASGGDVPKIESNQPCALPIAFFLAAASCSPFAATTEELFPPRRPHFWIDLLIQP